MSQTRNAKRQRLAQSDRQQKKKAGRRPAYAVTLLVELFETAMGANDLDSVQDRLLEILEIRRRSELQERKMSARLSDTTGIGDDERKDLTARLAELRLLEYVASVAAGKIEQRLRGAGQQLVRMN